MDCKGRCWKWQWQQIQRESGLWELNQRQEVRAERRVTSESSVRKADQPSLLGSITASLRQEGSDVPENNDMIWTMGL